jgi:cytochrome c oxidase subunit 1
VNPPVRVPAALNGFGLWTAIVLVLMILTYGYPIGQFFWLEQHSVPAIVITSSSDSGGRL